MQEISYNDYVWMWVYSSEEEKIQKITLDKKNVEKQDIISAKKQGTLSRKKKLEEKVSLLSLVIPERIFTEDVLEKILPVFSRDISYLLSREETMSRIRGKPKDLVFKEEEIKKIITSSLTRIQDIVWLVYLNLSKEISLLFERSLSEGEALLLEELVILLAKTLLYKKPLQRNSVKEDFTRKKELLEQTLKFLPLVK